MLLLFAMTSAFSWQNSAFGHGSVDSPINPGISPYAIVALLHHIPKQFFLVGNRRRLLRPEWCVHHPVHRTVPSLWSLNWFFTQNLLTDLMLSFLEETKTARSFTTNFIQSQKYLIQWGLLRKWCGRRTCFISCWPSPLTW